MARILVHVTHGPEHPTRAALGFLVAKAGVEEGHEGDRSAPFEGATRASPGFPLEIPLQG